MNDKRSLNDEIAEGMSTIKLAREEIERLKAVVEIESKERFRLMNINKSLEDALRELVKKLDAAVPLAVTHDAREMLNELDNEKLNTKNVKEMKYWDSRCEYCDEESERLGLCRFHLARWENGDI